MAEKWRAVPGFEGRYEVSTLGRVRSLDRFDSIGRRVTGRIMKPTTDRDGYANVDLRNGYGRRSAQVHRLVLEAFVGPCPAKMQCCHGNGNPADNRLVNLRWGTSKENMRDRSLHGRHYQMKKSHCPRGHKLAPGNLMPGSLKRGWRSCLSCNREHAAARSANREFSVDAANARYQALMLKEASA